MSEKPKFVFGRMNYIIMFVALGIELLGFVVMASDGEQYGFGSAGLTTGPLLLLLGLCVQFFAIMHKPKKQEEK